MRILHVAYIYPPKIDVADGITAVVYNVTKELAKRGHEVAVYTSNMLDFNGNLSLSSGHSVINGVNVYYSRSMLSFKTFIVTPNSLSLLSKKLNDFDVVHIHDCRSFQGICTYLLSKLKNVPYVFQPHGSYLSSITDSPTKMAAKIALDKLAGDEIVRCASRVLVLNRVEADLYKNFGVMPEKIEILPNGLDLTEFANLPAKGSFKKKIGVTENEKIILYIGRLHKSKGLDLLAKAFSIVAPKVGSVKLVVIGPDDGYEKDFVNLLDSLEIEKNVILTGYVDKQTKMSALIDSCVFVTPFFYGFPMTFLEACIAGVPIVATNFGDSLDWINDNVGIITLSTESALAKALYILTTDDILRETYSKNCKEFVRSEFSVEKVVDKLEQVYTRVIEVN